MTKISKNASVTSKSKFRTLSIVTLFVFILFAHTKNKAGFDDILVCNQCKKHQNVEPVTEYQKCISKLPEWVKTSSAFDIFAAEMIKGSKGLSDKTQISHKYQYMYQRYMAAFAQRVCEEGRSNKIRILEIGLGCSPKGGMLENTPGGSANGWRYLFPAPAFDLDLHVMEFDGECGKKWETENPGIAIVHHGDSSNPESLKKLSKKPGVKNLIS